MGLVNNEIELETRRCSSNCCRNMDIISTETVPSSQEEEARKFYGEPKQKLHQLFSLGCDSNLFQGKDGHPEEVTFRLGNHVDYCDRMFVSYQLENGSDEDCELVDALSSIDHYTVSCNSAEVQKLYGFALRTTYLATNEPEKLLETAPKIGICPDTFRSILSIPRRSTKTVFFPIDCIISRSEIPLWRPQTNWTLRIRHKVGSKIVVSGNIRQIRIVGDYSLWIKGRRIDVNEKQRIDRELDLGGSMRFRCETQYLRTYSLGSLSPFQEVSLERFAIPRKLRHLFYHLQDVNAVGEALHDSLPLQKFGVTNINLQEVESYWTNNTVFIQGHAYCLSFVEDPEDGLECKSEGEDICLTFTASSKVAVEATMLTVCAVGVSSFTIDFNEGKVCGPFSYLKVCG